MPNACNISYAKKVYSFLLEPKNDLFQVLFLKKQILVYVGTKH